MKVSALAHEQLNELTTEQVESIVFDLQPDDGANAEAALLLGGIPDVLSERAEAAAQLYHAGRVRLIIPTGGVYWDTEFGRMTEAECMTTYLKKFGVPEEAILLENQATTTRENMILAALLLERKLRPRGKFNLMIVTSAPHLRRSMALAGLYLPRTANLIGIPGACKEGYPGEWHKDPFHIKRVHRELVLIKETVDVGDMEDIEF